jgi:hypothetical protein
VNRSRPDRAAAAFAEDVAKRLERAGPLMQVLADAGHSDPDLAALHQRFHQARRRNLRLFADALAANAPHRVSRPQAADTVWALASPDLHTFLTQTAGGPGSAMPPGSPIRSCTRSFRPASERLGV